MKVFLRDGKISVSKCINWNDEFVRDEIKHSWDAQDKRMAKSAAEVLENGVNIGGQLSWVIT